MQEENIQIILQKWDEARKQSVELEKKMDKYKKMIGNYLAKKNLQSLETAEFCVKKRIQNRNVLTKKSIPKDVWDQYATLQRVEFLVLCPKKAFKKKS